MVAGAGGQPPPLTVHPDIAAAAAGKPGESATMDMKHVFRELNFGKLQARARHAAMASERHRAAQLQIPRGRRY